jgi:uncharacterized protein YjbJ (UPF0337 family)
MGAVDKTKNAAQRAKGKLKVVAGRATGNERLRRQGKADQLKRKVKQTGERVEDARRK